MNCSKCIPKNTAKEELERIEQRKEDLGCTKPTSMPQWTDNDTGENFFRCPIALVKKSSWMLVEIYNYLEAGFLPFSDGTMDQPAKLMGKLSLIRGFKIKYETEEQNKKGKK